MAKTYTLEEAADKLDLSVEELKRTAADRMDADPFVP